LALAVVADSTFDGPVDAVFDVYDAFYVPLARRASFVGRTSACSRQTTRQLDGCRRRPRTLVFC
jgi:hypothetical protein